MPALPPQRLPPLAALVGLAALLRFATLDVQSFWFDEAVTVHLVRMPFADMLAAIPGSESTPPLYYLLAWTWEALFGSAEIGLRSLSALLGTAAVPVAYLVGAQLVSRRAGLMAAALVAVNPLLVWYSQEARAYALLVLLAGLSLLFFARAKDEGRPRDLAWWAATSALALATHYFAVFLVVPEAIWLLARGACARRGAILASGAVAASGAALIPLALRQRSNSGAAFIEESSLGSRAAQAAKQFVVGFDAPAELVATLAGLALVGAGIALLAFRADPAERRGARVALAIGVIAIALPLALAIAGVDYFLTRNLIAAALPLAVALAAGLGARRAGRAGLGAAVALSALSLGIVVAVAAEPSFQRDDWRGAAQALGTPSEQRAIVVMPASGRVPLELYLPRARPMPAAGLALGEVDFIGLAGGKTGAVAASARPSSWGPPSLPGFRLVERRDAEAYTTVRLRSTTPAFVWPPGLEAAWFGVGRPRAAVLLEPPRD